MRKYKREFNVYVITNDINDMVYVGSTTTELWHRMSQHRAEAKNGAKSPLYDMMREYGASHFHIKKAMTSSADKIRQDEEFLINQIPPRLRLNYKRHSAKDTSAQFDYDEICRVYKACESQNMTANIIGCSRVTVQKALKSKGVEIVYPPHSSHKFRNPPSYSRLGL